MAGIALEIDPSAPFGPLPFPAGDPPEQLYRFRICGVLLEARRDMLSPDLWELLCLGRYETKELAGLVGVIRPGDTVLELGAGLGFISTFIARALAPRRVVAVEADPVVADFARRNHALNGVQVELRQGLVAQRAGQVRLHRQPGFWGNSTTWLPESHETVTLPALGFAELLAEVKPDVLVMDVEGGETSLFEGVDLHGVRAISLEVHRRLTGLAGIRDLFITLGRAGFAYEPTWSEGPIVVFGRV
jgi:FkbM family methyltransferase